ncbi:Nif11-like leader peptide family RiPP precursor [Azospirillum agricola]|uniref:Nif11-like leader peptide family RiPP precursor n=1 Tax=Azospirillum agricola TaxID=1720247 RepID=UPI000A0F31D2|nr:Nif11-like leader peptide family RiPP precursor [Azospirillum agricola]MBP2230952.1 putative ribosomally synthesized peptide with nif11-like leader [Azospirillum agricola]SMH28694.1 nif11-like leader peptide domain-containing protein [Azospirillum lipoferum]
MSQVDIQRFAAAVQADPSLLDAYRDIADPAALVARLRADGYDVSDDEIAAAIRRGRELSDEQLDQVSGGGVLVAVGVAATALAVVAITGLIGVGGWAAFEMARAGRPLGGR